MSNPMRYHNTAKIIHFKERLSEFEQMALNCELDYEDFPPEEYRYFSKLSRIGHLSWRERWDKEQTEAKKREYKREYLKAVEDREERLRYCQMINKRLIRTHEQYYRLSAACTSEDALSAALELSELLLNDPGLAARIRKNISRCAV